MTVDMVVVVLTLACLSALLWFFDYPYRKFRVDVLRHYLFAARDELFQRAAHGQIPFDHPAYGMTRQTLNGMIRFAHEISLWTVLLLTVTSNWWSNPETRAEYAQRQAVAMNSLTVRQRRVLADSMNLAHVALASHVLHSSILTFPFVFITKMCLRLHGTFRDGLALADRSAHSVPAPVLKAVDSEAYFYGDEDFQQLAA